MCLAVPALVVAIGDNDTAITDTGGVRCAVSLALLDDVQVGDYVIVHVGYALSKLDAADAEHTLQMIAQMRQAGDAMP